MQGEFLWQKAFMAINNDTCCRTFRDVQEPPYGDFHSVPTNISTLAPQGHLFHSTAIGDLTAF